MTRRKDRERYEAMRRLNPDYQGFRGAGEEATTSGNLPLETVTCSICGRRRNVAVGIAMEEGDSYICLSCREGQEVASEPEGAQV